MIIIWAELLKLCPSLSYLVEFGYISYIACSILGLLKIRLHNRVTGSHGRAKRSGSTMPYAAYFSFHFLLPFFGSQCVTIAKERIFQLFANKIEILREHFRKSFMNRLKDRDKHQVMLNEKEEFSLS